MRRFRRFAAIFLLLFTMTLIAAPALADCVIIGNGQGGMDYFCTGSSGTIQGTGGNDTITNEGSINSYIWSDGFSSNPAQIDSIINNGLVGDGTLDDGLWGGAGNDTITNNGVVNGGPDAGFNGVNGAIFGDGSEGIGDNDRIVHNGVSNGNIHGDYAAGGSDTIIINGLVNGGVYGEGPLSVMLGRAGNDTVILTNNAIVTALIDGMGGTDRLVFDFSTNDEDVYSQFVNDLNNADPASGSLSFGGRTFTWVNFEALENSVTGPGSVDVAVELPPPPAKLCFDMNFEETGALRSNVPLDRYDVNCRLLVENGQYMMWLGGAITNAGQIGDQSVLNQGIRQAVDVFSPTGKTIFSGDVVICLRGSGAMIYLNADQMPRVPQIMTAWQTPSFPGFTCATLYEPGTLVLVNSTEIPLVAAGDSSSMPALVELENCSVTTTDVVRLRAEPSLNGVIVTMLPYEFEQRATGSVPGWYRVSYEHHVGWVNADFVRTEGECEG